MKQLALSTLLLLSFIPSFAQRNCASMDVLEHDLATDPGMAMRMEAIENHTQHYVQSGGTNERVVITIPVVFHIIHNGDAVGSSENLSTTYINAQLDQLNKDFRKQNADVSSVPSAFAGLAADSEIQFCLAQRTPAGAATTGINRYNYNTASPSTSYIDGTIKPATIWDRTKYLNIWTANLGGGLLGYATFPGGTSTKDGVVVLASSVGSVATPNPSGGSFGKGRTATHEVGHWLNLRHIWGDSNCGNDQVSDTPTQQTSNGGCPSYPHVTCSNGPSGDMFMNYMDYVNDGCMVMFSTGQKNRMKALFATGGSRVSLVTSNGCTPPGGTGTCGTPSGLGSSSITSSSATVSWAAVSGATSYNVQYKTSAATSWTTLSTASTSLNLTGLSASTTYNWQVATVCSGTSSAYVAGSNFTTLASGGGGTCTAFEPNETSSAAAVLPLNTTSTAFICTSTDIDWYRFTTTSTATKVRVQMTSVPADYDMKLYNSSSTLLGTSENSNTNDEQLIVNATSTNTYYLRVYGYGGVFSSTDSYLLNVATSASNFRTTGLENAQNEISEISLFPNPSNDKVNISFISTAENNLTITVFDVSGRQIISQQATTTEGQNNLGLDVSQLQTGFYFVQVDNGSMRQQNRLVIAR
jgi:hypothetical protein